MINIGILILVPAVAYNSHPSISTEQAHRFLICVGRPLITLLAS